MGITLTSKTINSTYDSLLKLTDNDSLTSAFKVITDGLGNDTGISINNTGNVNISGTLVVNTKIQTPLLQITGGTGTQGTLSWNADEETLDLVNNGAVLQLGQEVHVHVRNNSATTAIPNGTPVYVTGTLGASGRLKVAPMIADGSIDAKYFIGVTTETIEADGDGKVTWFGKVRDFDTLTYGEGVPLYVSETVAGGWQTTPPTAPNPVLEVAITVNAKSNGTIMIRGDVGGYLNSLHDVNVTSVTDNDLLVYNATDGHWHNSKTIGDISTGNITTSGYLRGPATFVIDPAAYGDETGLVQILGDLRVDGVTTTVNSTTVDIKDVNITLAKDALTAADANGAGITIAGANATLTYASLTDDFTFNKNVNAGTFVGALTGNVTGNVTGNADTASKWATARTITLGGDLTGNVSIDGSANVTLTAAVVDDSHNHDGRYYTETEADGKFLLNTTDTLTGDLTVFGSIDITNGGLKIDGTEVIDTDGNFQITGFDFTQAVTITDSTTGYPLKLYGVDTTVGSISTELQFYSGYDGGWYIENQTGTTYGASHVRILGREVQYGGIELTYNNTLIGGFYGDGIDLNNNTAITGTLSVSSTTTLSGTTNLYYTQLKDSLIVLDPNGSSYSTAIYRDGVNPHKFMGDGSGLTNLGNADTVDSKHATDFTLDYVTDNGATTTNSIQTQGFTSTRLASIGYGSQRVNIGAKSDTYSGYVTLMANDHADALLSSNLKIDDAHDLVVITTHSDIAGSGVVFGGNTHPNGESTINFYAKGSGGATAGDTYTAESAEMILKSNLLDVNVNTSFSDNVSIGQTAITSHRLYINGGTSTSIPLKIKNEGTGTSDYAEIHIANNVEDKLILGSIGSNYSATDWANSSYIYDTGQSYLRIKASSEMQLFSGGYTVASHKTLTLQSDGDVVVERGKLYTNNIYTSDTHFFDRGDGSDFSNIIRSSGFPSGGFTASNQKYWLEYSTKGGHHFVVNSDGGAGSAENNYDDFTIWQGAVDGDKLLSVSNVGNTDIYGTLQVHNPVTFTEQTNTVALYLDSIDESYSTRLRFRKNTNDYWSIDTRGTSEGNDLRFYRYNSGWDTVMTMDWANGYVGIQSDPSYPLHVAGKIYSTTEMQGGAATMRSYGGYAFFGSNSLSVPIAIGRDGTQYDIKITASGNTELGGNLKTETIGGSETISVGNQAGQRTMMPKNGAKFLGNSSTGAIRLKSPVNSGIDQMFTIKGTVFQYTNDGTFDFTISGYFNGGVWVNTSANIVGNQKNRTIRFGEDASGYPLIYIGEATDTWSYCYVYISEVNYGWSMTQALMDSYMDGWTISGSHTSFEDVNTAATKANPLRTSWIRNGTDLYYSEGVVAIGNNTAYAPLDVTSLTSGSSGVVQYSYNSSPSSYRLRLDTEVSSGLVKWKWNMLNAGASYNDVMVFDRGNIGIGGNPNEKLHVIKTGGTLFNLQSTSSTSYSEQRFQANDSSAYFFKNGSSYGSYGGARAMNYYNDQAGHNFHTNAVSNILNITNSGRVGVKETNPASELDVNGTITTNGLRYDGSYTFNLSTYTLDMYVNTAGGWARSLRIWNDLDNSTTTAFGNCHSYAYWHVGDPDSLDLTLYNASQGIKLYHNGNVVVGNVSANQKFVVDGNIRIGDWATSGSRYIGFGRQDTGAFGTGGASGLEIESVYSSGLGNFDQNVHLWTHWYNNGSQRVLTATWNRRVGVNNTNPTQALDVSGNIKLGNQSGATSAPNFIDLGNNYSDGYTRSKCKIFLYNSGSEQYGFSVGSVGDVQYHSNVNHDHYIGNVRKTRLNSSTLDVYNSLRAGNNGYDSTPNGTSFSHTLAANSGTSRVVSFDGNGQNPSVWWHNGNSAKGAIDAMDEGLSFWCNNNSGGWYQNFYIEPDRTIFNRNVGIGVTSPSPYKLSVSGETHLNNGTGNGLTINTTVADNNTRNAIQLYEDDGQATGRQAITWYNGNVNYVKARLWTQVGSGYNNTKFGIDVADNSRSVSTRLWIYNGDTYMSGDVIAYASSDKRLKDNIKPIENAIDKVKKIGGYEFDWNDKQESHKGHDVGVIAQEIEEVLPEVVTERDNGYKAVKYDKLVALLIQGMKEQQEQIDELKRRLDGSTN